MKGSFFNVSGVDPNEGAKIVFVWGHDGNTEASLLLGSGHIVRADSGARPPGIATGQFSVTFLLPSACLAGDVVVTDDVVGAGRLNEIVIFPCSGDPTIAAAGTVIAGRHSSPPHRLRPFGTRLDADAPKAELKG